MDERHSPSSGGYEEIRSKLRARGYLEGRIERFMLQDLLSRRSRLFRLPRTALRAALIGGPLLGALLAVAAAAANRPLVGAIDLVLLWVYFTPLSGAALFLVDLAVATLVVALARRRGARPGDALRAALLVGLPTLVYVLLLWWKSRPVAGSTADLLFLPVAVIATVLIAWLAGLVSLAGVIGRTGQVPDRRRRTWLLLALVLVPLGIASLILRGVPGLAAQQERPSSFEVRDGERILVLGIDGLDSTLVEAFEPRGALESLLSTLAQSSVYPRSRDAAAEPAEVWTTLMTGMPAREHGVTSAGAHRLPGIATPLSRRAGPLPLKGALMFLLPARTVPTTGAVRRVRTLWEIVGLREASLAVGWWASWPATRDPLASGGGYLVSDRVLPKLLSGAANDRDSAPAALFSRLQTDFAGDRQELRRAFEAEFSEPVSAEVEGWLWESFLIDAYAWKVGGRLLGDDSLRAGFLYLPGLDILRHRLDAGGAGEEMAGLLATQAALQAYLRWLDSLIADVRMRAERWQLVLIADPGRQAEPGAEGFVAVLSPAATEACVGPRLEDVDLAPLVLTLAGFPASGEMPGGLPDGDCLRGPGAQDRRIATYGRRPRSAALVERSDYDPEMVERLKSLGYLN